MNENIDISPSELSVIYNKVMLFLIKEKTEYMHRPSEIYLTILQGHF